ncbi:hypothetical protein Tco_0456378 [Tanacetum coccineum]
MMARDDRAILRAESSRWRVIVPPQTLQPSDGGGCRLSSALGHNRWIACDPDAFEGEYYFGLRVMTQHVEIVGSYGSKTRGEVIDFRAAEKRTIRRQRAVSRDLKIVKSIKAQPYYHHLGLQCTQLQAMIDEGDNAVLAARCCTGMATIRPYLRNGAEGYERNWFERMDNRIVFRIKLIAQWDQRSCLLYSNGNSALNMGMFPEEADKIERYIVVVGMPNQFTQVVVASKPIDHCRRAIEMATGLLGKCGTPGNSELKAPSEDKNSGKIGSGVASAYAVGVAGQNPDNTLCTAPTTLDHGYNVELADGSIIWDTGGDQSKKKQLQDGTDRSKISRQYFRDLPRASTYQDKWNFPIDLVPGAAPVHGALIDWPHTETERIGGSTTRAFDKGQVYHQLKVSRRKTSQRLPSELDNLGVEHYESIHAVWFDQRTACCLGPHENREVVHFMCKPYLDKFVIVFIDDFFDLFPRARRSMKQHLKYNTGVVDRTEELCAKIFKRGILHSQMKHGNQENIKSEDVEELVILVYGDLRDCDHAMSPTIEVFYPSRVRENVPRRKEANIGGQYES